MDELLRVSGVCTPRKSNCALFEVIDQKSLSIALLANTKHVVAIDAVSVPEVTEQPVVDVLNVTAPVPEPPLVVNVIGVPTTPLLGELLTDNAACGLKKVNTLGRVEIGA